MKKVLYRVTQAVWGSDYPANLYFEKKEEADEYYNYANNVEKPKKVTLDESEAADALIQTDYYLNPEI